MDVQEIFELVKQFAGYVLALLSAIISLVICKVQSKEYKEREKIFKEQIERARSRETYTKCPKCGSKIPLSEVNFYLPGDIRDNNLNGVDDSKE